MSANDRELSVRQALLRIPTIGGRRWRRFADPVDTLTAWELDEVPSVIDAVERAALDGQWVVGFVSYDSAPAFDRALAALRDPNAPLAAFGIFDGSLPVSPPIGGDYSLEPWVPGWTEPAYIEQVRHIRRLIEAGETYQVNLTLQLEAAFSGDPMGFAAAMIRAQRSDHVAFIDLGDAAVCSASPELFLRRIGRRVETRPMKGTRPRHPDPQVDRALVEELARSAKDRAENTMIVDMARNDLARVAETGSVAVPRMHQIETYPTVHQMVSVVRAETEATLGELLAATFPAASITGAPKVATSRIIAEIEDRPRGLYTGAIGHVGPGGSLELSVAIRTAWVDLVEGKATYGVGGGIVWDSVPEAEWKEAMAKAHIVYRARRSFRLLETLAWDPSGGPLLIERHLARMQRSAQHFGFDIDVDEAMRLIGSVDGSSPRRLRLLVAGDGTAELQDSELEPADPAAFTVPFDDRPVDSGDEFLAHKTTRRERYDEALSRFPAAADVLLWNERGEITESTVANLVAEIDGVLVTPAASSGLLPGTLRADLLDAGSIIERVVHLADMRRATRTWLINSVRGWMPIEIDRTTEEHVSRFALRVSHSG